MVYQRRKIFGVGINDWESSCHEIVNGEKKLIKEYRLWRAMLSRCFSEYTKNQRPTYKDTTCQDSWKSMKSFIQDVSMMKGYDLIDSGWVLDKDILVKGNKHYSKETCCFVPAEINGCLTVRTLHRGTLPLGVTYTTNPKAKKKFVARCGYNGKRTTIGYYNTAEEAFEAYRVTKTKELRRLADKYKHQLDEKVYLALLNYDFTIND